MADSGDPVSCAWVYAILVKATVNSIKQKYSHLRIILPFNNIAKIANSTPMR